MWKGSSGLCVEQEGGSKVGVVAKIRGSSGAAGSALVLLACRVVVLHPSERGGETRHTSGHQGATRDHAAPLRLRSRGVSERNSVTSPDFNFVQKYGKQGCLLDLNRIKIQRGRRR